MQAQAASFSSVQQDEADIIRLFGSLSLQSWPETTFSPRPEALSALGGSQSPQQSYEPMDDASSAMEPAPEAQSYPHLQPYPEVQSSPAKSSTPPGPVGCAILQALETHLTWRTGPTSSSDFIDTILTHRDAFLSFPAGHRTCSTAFDQLADALQVRKMDGDEETARTLRAEAWLFSGWH